MAHEITIPRLGWSMEEGTFIGWLKKDGDYVQQGDVVFEFESEKAVQQIESIDEGILRIPSTGPESGCVLQVGTIIGYLVAKGESLPDATQPVDGVDAEQPAEPQADLPPVAAPSVRRMAREAGVNLSNVKGTGRGGRIVHDDVDRAHSRPNRTDRRRTIASPRARRVAAELRINWTQLSGTGAGGRVRESDVRAAVADSPSLAAQHSKGIRIPHSNRRQIIAQRMVASHQQTVPVTLTSKAVAENLVNLREQFKANRNSKWIPSYQDIITKLVGEILKEHPLLCGRWEEDAIVLPGKDELHLGMAVDVEGGLLVPVIRNVGGLSLAEISEQSQNLVEQARAGTLAASDMQGGVFTISNLGSFGIDAFTPVINLPEAAILGLGAIRREPIVLEDGQIVAQHQMTLNLTFDHRIVDGAPAARFLQSIANTIANPSASLLRG